MSLYLRSLSFKSKALLVLGGLQLLGLLLLGTVAYDQSQEALERLAHDKLQLGMEAVSKDLADYVRDESRIAMMLSSMPPIESLLEARLAGSGGDPAVDDMLTYNLAQIFTSAATLHEECLELTLLDRRGMEVMRVIASGNKVEPVASPSLRPRANAHYFFESQPLSRGQVYVSPLLRELDPAQSRDETPARDEAAGPPLTLWISAPVFTRSDEFSGVLALHLNPGEMLERIRSPLAEGRAFLVDERGAIAFRSVPSSMAMPVASELAGLHPQLAEILAENDAHDVYINCELEAMAGPKDHGDHDVGLCMHGYGKVYYDPLNPDNYWTVVFDAPPQVIFAPSRGLRDRFIGWGSLVIAVSLLLTFLLSNRLVVKPVLHLGEAAERVAGGDLHPVIEPYERDDEIGRLYTSFGVMLDRLRTATENLQEEIVERTRELQHSETRLEQQNEQLERLNSYKSHLLSVVSHELKTPLASLDGFGRIINQIILTDPFLDQFEAEQREKLSQVRQRVEIMGRNTGRLIRLVNELLDFSRIDRGRGLEMRKERVDMGALIRETVDAHAELGAKKGLVVAYVGPLEPVGLWVEADPDRIEQVFANLLDNAIKFSDDGDRIEVSAEQGDGNIEFQVRDRGDGIEADALERVFDLYEQAGDTVSRKQGAGIGLAIAKYIVGQHGGDIRATSPGPGRGSTFIFSLPVPVEQPVAAVAGSDAIAGGVE